MQDAPQGLIEFAGIKYPISGDFTFTTGISPSMATITCAPQNTIVWKVGPMVVSYGTMRITFPDCTADKIAVERASDGSEIWRVTILDRRWKWRECGTISGYYNVRRGSEKIVEDTEKTPQELAKMCLKAMGETRYDVSVLPELPRPEIEWDYELPANALAALCDQFGCRVVLQLNNVVKIVKAGVGNHLPIDALATAGGVAPDPPERPDSLVFVAAPNRYQLDLTLEAVGQDIEDGQLAVKRINELSYIPIVNGQKTWEALDSNCYSVTDEKFRKLAVESVFRWYRIVEGLPLKELGIATVNLDRILPIEDVQIEQQKIGDRVEPIPAWVYGLYSEDLDTLNDGDDESTQPNGDVLNKPKGLFKGSWSLDVNTGIVKFSQQMYRHEDSKLKPAKLKLRTTVSMRDEKTRAWQRHEVKRKLTGPKAGTLPRYITRDDVALETYYDKGADKHDNKEEVEKQAKHYLDAAEAEYQFTLPASVTYAGFRAINPDGAIQQVSWSNAGGPATTRASRNTEDVLYVPSYKERRRMERAREAEKVAKKTTRQKAAKEKKGQA